MALLLDLDGSYPWAACQQEELPPMARRFESWWAIVSFLTAAFDCPLPELLPPPSGDLSPLTDRATTMLQMLAPPLADKVVAVPPPMHGPTGLCGGRDGNGFVAPREAARPTSSGISAASDPCRVS
mmetsp:Transcript_39104/g.112397  ORF Transcript_39104/g.112397 Transcript_39104/m.112397 type:complete len:126 (-) Transcript_39104:40-417(-)